MGLIRASVVLVALSAWTAVAAADAPVSQSATTDALAAELDALVRPEAWPPGALSPQSPSATAPQSALTPAGLLDRARHADAPRYRIAAAIDPVGGIVVGMMQIDFVAEVPAGPVELRLRPRAGLFDDASLVVTNAYLTLSSHIPSLTVHMAPLGEACTLTGSATAAGAISSIVIDWKMKLSQTGGTGGLDALSDAGAILYHWYPELARRDHGAWVPVTATTIPPDVGLADASFAVSVPAGWDVAGTLGAIPTTTPTTNGQRREYRWRNPLSRQTALAVGHFSTATQTLGTGADAITLQSFWLKGDDHGGKRALAAAAAAVARNAALLGPYPYAHLDVVDADVDEPGFAADGLIILPQMTYPKPIRPPRIAKDLPDDLLTFTYTQTARLWWSHVIGTDAAKSPWLAEGIAGWCAVDCTAAQVDPPTACTILEDRLAELRENVQDQDFPLDQDLSAFPGDRYPAMRDKGTLALVALRQQIGDAPFRAFLGDLARNRFGAGLTNDQFRAALAAKIGPIPAAAFYAKWIHDGALDLRAATAITASERAAAGVPAAATPAAHAP